MAPKSDGVDWNFGEAHRLLSSVRRGRVDNSEEPEESAPSTLNRHLSTNGQEHVAVPNNPHEAHNHQSSQSSTLGDLSKVYRHLNLPPEGVVPPLPDGVRQERPDSSHQPQDLLTAAPQGGAHAYMSDGAILQRAEHMVSDISDTGNITSVQVPSQRQGDVDATNDEAKGTRRRLANQRRSLRTTAREQFEAERVAEMNEDVANFRANLAWGQYLWANPETTSREPKPRLIPNSVLKPVRGQRFADDQVLPGQARSTHPKSPVTLCTAEENARADPRWIRGEGWSRESYLETLESTSFTPPIPYKGADSKKVNKILTQMSNDGLDRVLEKRNLFQKNTPLEVTESDDFPSKDSQNLKEWPVADPGTALQTSTRSRPKPPTLAQVLDDAYRNAPDMKPSADAWPASFFANHNPNPALGKAVKAHHQLRPRGDVPNVNRHWRLFGKIIGVFPEDRVHLLDPRNLLVGADVDPMVHVFIDASNILIGFVEHLKRIRKIPKHVRVGQVYPSFASLALLLERRRPVAKRVLAGSTPPFVTVYEEAKMCGYELNILHRVKKVREPTERQKHFAARDAARRNKGHASGANGDPHSASDSGDAMPPVEKWVEQGVDEVLNNKMGESLADTPDPPGDAQHRPIAVLATGDAQQAEYSSGFGAWTRRMLKHGWIVEIVAWSANLSNEYYIMQKEWAGRLIIITLDDFAEELFLLQEEN